MPFYIHRFKRTYSTVKKSLSSEDVRKHFLEYFIKGNHHQYVKSSPVFPYFDSSIPFVNAGMCQFKRILTDQENTSLEKVANSQKCVRIAGKHNDLQVAGIDSYHHTFFEMLGNWSFGAYNEEFACQLAWNLLLSDPYKIPKHRLYVTYFGGSETYNLPADDQIKEIWLKLGVEKDHILPFSMEENFWEMGVTGPCGTCTEIHVALTDEFASSPHMVNKGHPLLTELWNIVFIRYKRTLDGTIEILPKCFIDTGMGFERLVALLQGKTSNYDTDLFAPLFKKISEVCNCPSYAGGFITNDLNTAYRYLVDFSRMVTVVISDNIFPDVNPKLKRILRKSLFIAENDFKHENPTVLLNELANVIAESLHPVFPEVGKNLNQVKKVIENEAKQIEILQSTHKTQWEKLVSKYPILQKESYIEYPGLINGYQFLINQINANNFEEFLPADVTVNLYTMFGLENEIIEKLLKPFGLKVNQVKTQLALKKLREESKMSKHNSSKFSNIKCSPLKTDDSFKYEFIELPFSNKVFYQFPERSATVLKIIECGNDYIQDKLISTHLQLDCSNKAIGVITDRTNFYAHAGGQCSDTGEFSLICNGNKFEFRIQKVEKIDDMVVHYCDPCVLKTEDVKVDLKVGDKVMLKLDAEKRCCIMQNHTASHLLTAAVKQIFPFSHFKNGEVTDQIIKSVFAVYGYSFNKSNCDSIEKIVNNHISEALPVHRTITNSTLEVLNLPNISFTPGEVYRPEDIHIVSIIDNKDEVVSRELCCGTHLSNTKYVENFCINKMSFYKSASMLIIEATTGNTATAAVETGKEIERQSRIIINEVNCIMAQSSLNMKEVIKVNENLSRLIFNCKHKLVEVRNALPCYVTHIYGDLKMLQTKLNKIVSSWSKEQLITELADFISMEHKDSNIIITFIALKHGVLQNCNSLYRLASLVQITSSKSCPMICITYVGGAVRCFFYVPNDKITERFSAQLWLKSTFNRSSNTLNLMSDNPDVYCMVSKIQPEERVIVYVESILKRAQSVVDEFIDSKKVATN